MLSSLFIVNNESVGSNGDGGEEGISNKKESNYVELMPRSSLEPAPHRSRLHSLLSSDEK